MHGIQYPLPSLLVYNYRVEAVGASMVIPAFYFEVVSKAGSQTDSYLGVMQ
jgi:hypothetical protein